MSIKTTLVSIVAVLALIAAAYVVLFQNQNEKAPILDDVCPQGTTRVGEGCMPLRDECEGRGDSYEYNDMTGECINTAPQAESMEIKIALLDTTGAGAGKKRGCDAVNMVTRTVPKSPAVLDAALKALFAEPTTPAQPDTAFNFIARTNSTLKYDHATITNGTANIYLLGSLSGLAGVCDDPRAAAQIEETALQFGAVTKVQLYLNGTATNLTPSQQ
ncbi:MAG: GerMN domain-containing protein [Minisyncoccia bacterium]